MSDRARLLLLGIYVPAPGRGAVPGNHLLHMTKSESPQQQERNIIWWLRQAFRIILLLILPTVISTSYTIVASDDCLVWTNHFFSEHYAKPCGYPFIYPDPPPFHYPSVIANVSFALMPLVIWIYTFRKLRPRSQ